MSRSYVEFRAKTNFSFLTGASHPEEIVQEAINKNLAGIALTDINGLYGMPKGYRLSKTHPQLKYICGAEFTFTDHPNITLLAKKREAYAVICRLVTESKRDKEKGEGNLEFRQFQEFMTKNSSKELTAIPRIDQRPVDVRCRDLRDIFGSDIFLPLTFYLDGQDHKRVQDTLEISRQFELPLLASNDVEYHEKQRKILQDVLISVREAKPMEEVGFLLRPNGERYIKSFDQMNMLYREFPHALSNTLKLAEEFSFSPSELKYRYPSEWIPEGHTAKSYLEDLVWKKAAERYKNGLSDKVRAQVLHELALIEQMNFADYFLTIYDVIDFAEKKEILCQGRGSAANSVICYILGITAIDPVQMDLLFERFISVERGEPPDIDIDFEHERREEVIQYIYEKYGRHRAGMVSAVVTYQFRSALRETAKAFGVNVGTLSAKKIEHGFDELIKDMPNPETLKEKIYSVANELHGFPRHLSIHSGGFTLSADPIVDIVPVEPARMENRTIIQWDKYDLDILGLLKVDFLSLGMLTALQKTLKLVGKKLYELPHDDRPTYEMIHRCETVGVFQIESRAQMSMLGRLKPNNFYDLVVEVAIVRPGPIVGKMVHPYLKRRKGIEKVIYPHPAVERILGRTMGVPLFQEQIMKLAIELAEFTPGEADILRKSINAWRTSEPIQKIAGRLMEGFRKNGLSREFSEQIFEHIKGFSHYGFPESHAASFALLAYASCYLKCHHPAEFSCSLINSQPMGFYRPDTILYEALRNGVEILPVSIKHSVWDSVIEKANTIRLGFSQVNGVREKDVEDLICERSIRPYTSMADFLKRAPLKSDVLERFALAGRFDEFHWESRNALWAILEYQNLLKKEDNPDQLSFFRNTEFLEEDRQSNAITSFPGLDSFEKIQSDYNAFSLSTHGHPMQEIRKTLPHVPKLNSRKLKLMPHGSHVRVAGLVLVRQKPPTAKGVCFSTLEDEFGFIDVVLWADIFEEYHDVFLNNCFITVEGIVQRDGNTISVLVKKVEPLRLALNIEPDQYFYG